MSVKRSFGHYRGRVPDSAIVGGYYCRHVPCQDQFSDSQHLCRSCAIRFSIRNYGGGAQLSIQSVACFQMSRTSRTSVWTRLLRWPSRLLGMDATPSTCPVSEVDEF